MSWKSIAWNAFSQAQKSIDTVLSSANAEGQVGYSELDPFSSDLSGFSGTNVYTSSHTLPSAKPPSPPDSDPQPESSECSDTDSSNQKLEQSIEGEDSTADLDGLADTNMSESTEFREVDLFSVPSRDEESLLDASAEQTANTKHSNDIPEPVIVTVETCNNEEINNEDNSCVEPGINVDIENAQQFDSSSSNDEHKPSALPSENGPIKLEDVPLTSSVSELQEMLRVREGKLFELHESYAQLHDKYEMLRENARSEVDGLLAEKDEQIQRLYQEGEKLYKQEQQQNNAVKKHKNTIKDLEYKNKVSASRLNEVEKANSVLTKEKSGLESSYKREQESHRKLESVFTQQEKELLVLKREQSNLLIRIEELTELNSKSNTEISSLRETKVSAERSSEKAVQSAEFSFQEQKQKALTNQEAEFMLERRSYQEKLSDLEQTLVWKEQAASRMEERMKVEVEELRAQLERGEQRIQQFSQSVSSSTQPLLREIEHLRSSQNDQSQNWASVESKLRGDLTQSHQENTRLREDGHLLQDEKQMLEIRLSSLDRKVGSQREEQQLSAQQLESLRAELAKRRTEEEDREAKFKLWQESYQASIEQLQEENRRLQTDLLDKEREINLSATYAKPFLSSLDLRTERCSDKPAEDEEAGLDRAHSSASLSDADQYSDTGAASSLWSSATQLDRLQQLVKQKEGQATSYKQQTARLEKACNVMTDELAKLTAANQDLRNRLVLVPKLRKQLQELTMRHDTTLEMYGERIEENEELKMDLKDIKELYKSQTEELVDLLERKGKVNSSSI